MTRENLTNFASSAITATINSSVTSFSVTGGTGSVFPTSNFVVTIDNEIMLITSRSSDTFTVGTRGFDGTTAASHTSGASVQLTLASYHQNRLWQNVPDSYHPDVMPTLQSFSSSGVLTGSASSYNSEFESSSGWTLSPSPSGSTTFTINTTMRSHLLFNRGTNDNALYTAYESFPLGSSTAFTATCKIVTGASIPQMGTQQAEIHFFASDLTNPVSSASSSNRFRIDLIQLGTATSNFLNASSYYARCWRNVGGASSATGINMPIPPPMAIYLRMAYDGAGTWTGYVGNGVVYWTLGTASSFSFNVQTLCFQFFSLNATGSYTLQTVAVDWVRVVTGSVLAPYGSLGD